MARTRSLGGIVGDSDPPGKARHVEQAHQAASLPPAPTREAKPVRLTLDLTPELHAQLQRWCLDAAPGVGRPRVAGQQVLRALIGRLLTNEQLAREITLDLRTH